MTLTPGATLGRYTLLKRLASSGDAEVLLARASGAAGFEHHVVIKRMKPEPGQDPRAVDMFLDELRLAGSLHHHHIVQVHDAGRDGSYYFFAMEYVHGEDLRKILTRVVHRGELVPLDHIVTIGMAIASALHHAHEQKTPDGQPLELVHRDVSPANVIVGYDGTVKVVDFGIAKAALRTVQTRAGTLRGKAPYMAPEQCAGRPIDRRADIFALGTVLWELVTARRLFKGVNDFMTMAAIVSGKVPAPARIRADLPADFEKIIMKALSPAPEARFQTAEQLGVALEDMATNNIIRISQAALAAYLKQLFGQRPEPWLVDEADSPPVEVDVDFDGAPARSVVKVTTEQISNLDAVREVVSAHAEVEETDDEFDDEPMTDLVDTGLVSHQAPDVREITAAIEAAKLLRSSTAMAAVTPRSDFDVSTTVADDAETDRLRRMSAHMPAVQPLETPPNRPAPTGTAPSPILQRPTPPSTSQPPAQPHVWTAPATTSAPMSWALPQNQDLIPEREPAPNQLRWSVVIMVGVIVLSGLAVLIDLVLR